jgi:hypothetical protein
MAFTAFAGSSGSLSYVTVSVGANTDEITFAGTATNKEEIVSWRISDSGGTNAEKLSFGSSANAAKVKYPTQLAGGTGRWTAQVTAVASATIGALVKGTPLVCDFLFHSNANVGYKSCNCKVEAIDNEQSVNAQHATINFTVVGSGPLPAIS